MTARGRLTLSLVLALCAAPTLASAETVESCVAAANEAERLRTSNPRRASEKFAVCASSDCPEVIRAECNKALGDLDAKLRASSPQNDACVAAAMEAAVLREDGTKHTKTRDRLRACAASQCPDPPRSQCKQLLAELEAKMASVLLFVDLDNASASASASTSAVRVLIDGVPLVERIDNQPVVVESGTHVFTFQRQGAPQVEVLVSLAPGQKNVQVHARFEAARMAAPVSEPATPVATTSGDGEMSTLRVVGLVTAGAGAVGLGLGAFFGLRAASKQSDADCAENRCVVDRGGDPQALRDAYNAGNLSTLFFVAGGILAAGGLAMFILGPRPSSTSAPAPAWARIRPAFGPGSAALLIDASAF